MFPPPGARVLLMTKENPAEPRFDDLLRELESQVDRLERGDLPLEDALSSFEKGMGIAKRAAQILDGAEAKVEELLEGQGAPGE